MPERNSVAQFLAAALPEYGVSHVFELVGGMITTLLDALHQAPGITVVSCLHEQAAAFAAEGFARQSGSPAVAMATSGPGATNLLTGVGSCYFDSVPVVFITGQVNRDEMHVAGKGRQGGFQETDIVAMATPVTKWTARVTDASDFPAMLDRAFTLATEGRAGPVLLDIPMDVQREMIEVPNIPLGIQRASRVATGDERDMWDFATKLVEALQTTKRPLIIAGGGIRSSGSVDDFRQMVERLGIPVALSLLGIDAMPSMSPERVGFLGSYGNRWANKAIAASDLLLVLGSRLDVRQTGSDVRGFRGTRRVFHVDVDPGELNSRVTDCIVVSGDISTFIKALGSLRTPKPDRWAAWQAELETLKRRWPDEAESIPSSGLNPNSAIRQISQSWSDVAAFVTDVGQHQMWAAQSIQLSRSQRFITSGGMGAMGFGIPAAVGVALAALGRPVGLIAGDGGFQCNIQELQTITRLNLPVRMVIFDNHSHGMVRQFQQSYFDSRYFSSTWGYQPPDFVRVAEAYGVPARGVADIEELKEALQRARDLNGPSLISVEIEQELNVYPKLAFGREFGAMEPEVSPTMMEGT